MSAYEEQPTTTISFLDHQRRVLSRALVEEERRLSALQADAVATEAQTRRAQGTNDLGELSQLLVERVNGGSLEEQTKARLAEIEAALSRMDDGSYGRCAHCLQPIDRERLEALPAVAFCASCKASRDGARGLRSL
jgi:RNA polymerase-binding transcription factor DksA